MPVIEQSHCSCETLLNFSILSVVRGTTPLIIFFGVYYLHSACLVVALKCGISLILFTLSALLLLGKSAVRTIIKKNLHQKSTYYKLVVVGFLQSACPYLLLAYSVKYIPITLASVFMAITPWWVHLIECSPIIKKKNKRFPTVLKVGMVIGIIGIIMIATPVLIRTSHCVTKTKLMNVTNITSTSSNILQLYKTNILTGKLMVYCHSIKDIFNALIAIALVPILWAAAAVFWKRHQGDMHYIVSSIGQNVFGGIIASIVWVIFGIVTTFKPINWGEKHWIICAVYLGVATGWLGTLLARNLFSKLGSKTINQVLTGIPLIAFIEDCVFIRNMDTTHSYTLVIEMLGLLLVTAGVFISNIPSDGTAVEYSKGRGSMSEALLDSEYPNGGMDAGLNQILRNQIFQYEQHPENECDNDDNDDAEEPLPTLDPEIKVKYPILTDVS